MNTEQPLDAHLAGTLTTVCHCWRIVRRDGRVLGFTDHDVPLLVDGTLFDPRTGFSASEARDVLGLAPDVVEVEGALSSQRISEAEITAGSYDGASVETLLVNWRNPVEYKVLKRATVGRISRADGRLVAELNSAVHLLDQQRGRYIRRSCDAELGDRRCGVALDQAKFSASGAVLSRQGPGAFSASGLEGFEAGWFSQGVLTWSTGDAAGRRLRVRNHAKRSADAVLALWTEGSEEPQPGDRFTIVAGCDKRFETCKSKFANSVNFRGFPHLPGNDAGYSYVKDDAVFDGRPLVP